jgi:hypothetical protein
MNETFDTEDMNISLSTFGSAPILREGEAVNYDLRGNRILEALENPKYETQIDNEFDGAEEINE